MPATRILGSGSPANELSGAPCSECHNPASSCTCCATCGHMPCTC